MANVSMNRSSQQSPVYKAQIAAPPINPTKRDRNRYRYSIRTDKARYGKHPSFGPETATPRGLSSSSRNKARQMDNIKFSDGSAQGVKHVNSVKIRCKHCGNDVVSLIQYEVNPCAHICACLMCVSVVLLPFFWVPYFCKTFKTTKHFCPSCRSYLCTTKYQ